MEQGDRREERTEQASGQPTQMEPWTPPVPQPYKPSHRFGVAKLVVGGCTLVFAIITLGLGLGLGFVGGSAAFVSTVSLFIMILTAAVSIIWQTAEFLTRLLRRRNHRPIHPGAHVGMHLCLWLLCVLCVLSLAFILSYALADYTIGSADDCYDDSSDSDSESYSSYRCADAYRYDYFATQSDASRFFALLEALVAFATALTVGHFVLFVMACVETTWRRRHGRRNKVVYLVAAEPGEGEGGKGYYVPVPAPAPAPRAAAAMSSTSPGERTRQTVAGGGGAVAGPDTDGGDRAPKGVVRAAPAATRFSISTTS